MCHTVHHGRPAPFVHSSPQIRGAATRNRARASDPSRCPWRFADGTEGCRPVRVSNPKKEKLPTFAVSCLSLHFFCMGKQYRDRAVVANAL
jgi:hypothetical protein